jgi:hypothetical protein
MKDEEHMTVCYGCQARIQSFDSAFLVPRPRVVGQGRRRPEQTLNRKEKIVLHRFMTGMPLQGF